MDLKIDAINALYPERFCDKILAIRKVFAFCVSANLANESDVARCVFKLCSPFFLQIEIGGCILLLNHYQNVQTAPQTFDKKYIFLLNSRLMAIFFFLIANFPLEVFPRIS